MEKKHLLIVGSGSVGKRHLSNFSNLGCQLSVVDPRTDRLDEASKAAQLLRRFSSLEEALSRAAGFSGVVICSPPKFHVEQAIAALRVGLPVFLEKPVSPDAVSAARLVEAVQQTGVPLLVGYTYRWWPPLGELKNRLEKRSVGKVLRVHCMMSAHLADWHPWERYQDFFMASRELGGGALLDESHFIDLMLWLFGIPTKLFAKVERLSSLEIDTDDNVDAWLYYGTGLRIYVHLDLYGRPHEKYITITGDEGSLHWSFEPNRLRFSKSADQTWNDSLYTYERNDMFVNAAKEFLKIIDNEQAPSCSILEGYAVMRVIEAMRCSSAADRIVSVDEP